MGSGKPINSEQVKVYMETRNKWGDGDILDIFTWRISNVEKEKCQVNHE